MSSGVYENYAEKAKLIEKHQQWDVGTLDTVIGSISVVWMLIYWMILKFIVKDVSRDTKNRERNFFKTIKLH